jgi:uncharacterized protein YjbI with pentapeptide repeats
VNEERPTWRPKKPEDLPGQDLRDADLKGLPWLLPEHLARSDLTGNRTLPEEVAEFPAVAQLAAISSEARKIFIVLLAACVYSWIVIGTTEDVQLILNTATWPLPIINAPIPISGFYVVGAALLAAVYCYLHFYLQRLWRTLAALPAVFRDGVALDDKTDPWLLTNLVRADFEHLKRSPPPLTRLENLLTIFLAWWLVPLTLLALWVRYLPAHYWLGTTWLVAMIGVTALFGRHSYRLARATLRGEMPAAEAEGDDGHGVSRRAWHEFRQMRPDRLTVGLTAAVTLCSLSAFRNDPGDYTRPAKLLNVVGIRTYADLRDVNVAERPDGWDGKDWSKVKRVDLRGSNLTFADVTRAFLANADLRGANLGSAIFVQTELQGADLYDEDASWDDEDTQMDDDDARRGAQLQGADLRSAQLQGADLRFAQLQSADLKKAQLQGADLRSAQLQGANLTYAQLQNADLEKAGLEYASLVAAQLQGASLQDAQLRGASLEFAHLEGAGLRSAQLQIANLGSARLQGADLEQAGLLGASLESAELQGANLKEAQLQGADLDGAELQGADLSGTIVWRTQANGARLDFADLRGSNVPLMTISDLRALVSEATKDIPDEVRRTGLAETLTFTILGPPPDVSPRPEFLEERQLAPNAIFSAGYPFPAPADWGRHNWATEEAYDEDLATFLGDLACGRDVPEAQAQGLARRALLTFDFEPKRVWPALFAKQVTGPNCPPAKGLAEDMRRQLEQLAAQGDAAAASPQAAPPDPVE